MFGDAETSGARGFFTGLLGRIAVDAIQFGPRIHRKMVLAVSW